MQPDEEVHRGAQRRLKRTHCSARRISASSPSAADADEVPRQRQNDGHSDACEKPSERGAKVLDGSKRGAKRVGSLFGPSPIVYFCTLIGQANRKTEKFKG